VTRSLIALALAAGAAAADIPLTDDTGRYTLDTLWIEGGMGPGIASGDVANVSTGQTSFDQSLDGSWQPGMHAGVEWQRAKLHLDGEGWGLGLAVWYDRAPGRITAASTPSGPVDVDVDLEVESLSLAVMPTWIWRFDGDALDRVTTSAWQWEVAPILAIGAARAQVDGGDTSSVGLAWQAGARVRLHARIVGGLRAGIHAGATWFEARPRWDNTGQATFSGFSPLLGAALGYEF
jgi:hypothetical protein